MKIKNYREFLNEKRKMSVSDAQDLLETDLLTQDFIKKIFGANPEYTLDTQKSNDHSGDTEVWIDIVGPSKEALKELENYNEFVKPFAEWAKKHNLYDAEILGGPETLLFKVII